jgi:hypothetical protein
MCCPRGDISLVGVVFLGPIEGVFMLNEPAYKYSSTLVEFISK